MTAMIDVILLSGFRRAAKKLFSAAELEALSGFLGNHPGSGVSFRVRAGCASCVGHWREEVSAAEAE